MNIFELLAWRHIAQGHHQVPGDQYREDESCIGAATGEQAPDI